MTGPIVAFVLATIVLPVYSSFAKQTFPFAGDIDFKQKNLSLQVQPPGKGKFSIVIDPKSPENYHFLINLDRAEAGGFIVTTQLEGTVLIERFEGALISVGGEIKSRDSVVNGHPVRELAGIFQIKDKVLNFSSLSLGNITAQGFIDLTSPHKLDLSFNLTALDLADFIGMWLKDGEYKSSGLVSGQIKVSGQWNDPHLNGQLESYQGIVGDLVYDSLKVNFDGRYPLINLYNSSASKTNGFSFKIEGGLDLSDKKTLVKQIDALAKNPIVDEDETNREWTLKRFESQDVSATTQLKYELKKNEDVSHPLKEDSLDMLGIERRVEF